MRSSSIKLFQPILVACNVYISAGGAGKRIPNDASLLLRLLKESQEHCIKLSTYSLPSSLSSFGQQKQTNNNNKCNNNNNNSFVSIIHAFSDQVYDRSSFHIAGTPEQVAEIVSVIAQKSIEYIGSAHNNDETIAISTTATVGNNHDRNEQTQQHAHPFVGFIDHIAVMPLNNNDQYDCNNDGYPAKNSDENNNNVDDKKISSPVFDISTNPTGFTARLIGNNISKLGIEEIYYYGNAHEDKVPLAVIRREKTNFFKSGGLENHNSNNDNCTANNKNSSSKEKQGQGTSSSSLGIATIGAPEHFVENYNIRTTSNIVNKKQAQSLTKYIRERDGSGLRGVEALTLPYSNHRYEAACNLLQPHVCSADHIQKKALEWEKQQQQQQIMKINLSKHNNDPSPTLSTRLIETMYRVGTTKKQCLDVLSNIYITPNINESDSAEKISQQQRNEEIQCDNNQNSYCNTNAGLEEKREQHDQLVMLRFQEYLGICSNDDKDQF